MHNPPLILIIDDDAQLADLFAIKLKTAGFGIIKAVNGEEGFKVAKKDKPDLILLDLRMPVMNGIETLGVIKQDQDIKDIKVIIFSSFNDWSELKIDQSVARNMGAADFMEKGTDLNELIIRIKSILGLPKPA